MVKDKQEDLSLVLEARLFFVLGGGVRWFHQTLPQVYEAWRAARLSCSISDRPLSRIVQEALSSFVASPSSSPKERLEALDQKVRRLLDPQGSEKQTDQERRIEQAVKSLITEKFWMPGPKGRLLKQGDRWDLLWPLAGRDLNLRVPMPMDQIACHLSGAPEPRFEEWIREDGRTFQGLITSIRIQRILCGDA